MNRNVARGRFPIYKADKAAAARSPRERHYARFMRLQNAVFFHTLKTSSDRLESGFSNEHKRYLRYPVLGELQRVKSLRAGNAKNSDLLESFLDGSCTGRIRKDASPDSETKYLHSASPNFQSMHPMLRRRISTSSVPAQLACRAARPQDPLVHLDHREDLSSNSGPAHRIPELQIHFLESEICHGHPRT
jgi:hypothetical protein